MYFLKKNKNKANDTHTVRVHVHDFCERILYKPLEVVGGVVVAMNRLNKSATFAVPFVNQNNKRLGKFFSIKEKEIMKEKRDKGTGGERNKTYYADGWVWFECVWMVELFRVNAVMF